MLRIITDGLRNWTAPVVSRTLGIASVSMIAWLIWCQVQNDQPIDPSTHVPLVADFKTPVSAEKAEAALLISSLGTPLPCVIGPTSGLPSEWGSSWCDLPMAIDFKKGDVVRITLASNSTAREMAIRFLPKGQSPDKPMFVVAWSVPVPASRVVILTVPYDLPSIGQISVHGGGKAWNHEFDHGNGPAVLQEVDR